MCWRIGVRVWRPVSSRRSVQGETVAARDPNSEEPPMTYRDQQADLASSLLEQGAARCRLWREEADPESTRNAGNGWKFRWVPEGSSSSTVEFVVGKLQEQPDCGVVRRLRRAIPVSTAMASGVARSSSVRLRMAVL